MKIALIGATGHIGSEIAKEIVKRGHALTVIARGARTLPPELAGALLVQADIFDAAALQEAVRGHDVIASAYGPSPEQPQDLTRATVALIGAARGAKVPRLVVVGGAGSLEVAPGKQLVDTPQFPEIYKAVALAHRDGFNLLRRADDLEWTFFAPAALIGPAEKVGAFRVGRRSLLADAAGNSRISYADYADAFVTELEQAQHRREIITVAY